MKSLNGDPKETQKSATEAITSVKHVRKDAFLVQSRVLKSEQPTTHTAIALARFLFVVKPGVRVGKLT